MFIVMELNWPFVLELVSQLFPPISHIKTIQYTANMHLCWQQVVDTSFGHLEIYVYVRLSQC